MAEEVVYELLVKRATWAADGVIVLDLVRPDGGALEPWEAGAHLDVILTSGLMRQYSLCGPLGDASGYRIAVLREVNSRGGSAEIHNTQLVGRRLQVRGPRNQFRLVAAERLLLLAGGIGVTPIVAMVETAEAAGTPWRLVYGGRSRSSMAFLDELGARRAGQLEVVAEDEAGFPDLEAEILAAPPRTAIYCCGPSPMIEAVEKLCALHGDPSALHVERFSAAPGASFSSADDGSFEVELARTGVVLTVPSDRSVLRTVLEVVPSKLYSCEEGYCGTCETRVLAGEPDHRDTVLSDEEREHSMMICVSRSRSARLVLDL